MKARKITPLYERLSRDDDLEGESNSISNQLVLWREAWANAVNRALERAGSEERIDHLSHKDRGLDEQPTVHEGVTARAMEEKGGVSDRCELNRQIRRDNALLWEIKAQVKQLTEAVRNTIQALAEAMETVRAKMIVFRYQIRHILIGRRKLANCLAFMKPKVERAAMISARIKEKSEERNTLLAEKGTASILNIGKRRELSRRTEELAEEMEELRSDRIGLLASMDYSEETGISVLRKDLSDLEDNLTKLEQEEKRFDTDLNGAREEYKALKAQAAEYSPDELASAQLAVRSEKEASAEMKVREAHGDHYDPKMMTDAKHDVGVMLGEEESGSVLERLKRRPRELERSQNGHTNEKKPEEVI